jgi:hypothetical protein
VPTLNAALSWETGGTVSRSSSLGFLGEVFRVMTQVDLGLTGV